MKEKYVPPHISRTFVTSVRAGLGSTIFFGALSVFALVGYPIYSIFAEGEVIVDLFIVIPGVLFLLAACGTYFGAERRDYYTKSFERKVGIVTDIKEVNTVRRTYCHIFLNDEKTNYAVDAWGPHIKGSIDARNTTDFWIHFRKGSKVELFYGRHSRIVVWANILSESEFEDMLAKELAKTND